MTFKVVFLRRAQADVEKIYEFIASRSALGASRWYVALSEAVASIGQNPDRCAAAPESERLHMDLRQRLFKTPRGRSYRLLFVIADDQVRVLRIRGPGQPPLKGRDVQPAEQGSAVYALRRPHQGADAPARLKAKLLDCR